MLTLKGSAVMKTTFFERYVATRWSHSMPMKLAGGAAQFGGKTRKHAKIFDQVPNFSDSSVTGLLTPSTHVEKRVSKLARHL